MARCRTAARAILLYAGILQQHPDYLFVRLAYAQALYEDRRYADAKRQFAALDTGRMLAPTAKQTAVYQEAIRAFEAVSVSAGANIEHNDNVNNASKLPAVEDSRPAL